MRTRRALLFVLAILSLHALVAFPARSQSRNRSPQSQLRELRSIVKSLSAHQRDLEARIAVLERLYVSPPPEALRQSYITSRRDGIINEINNIAANAYQYRIRPTTMGGGGGTYLGYTIPKKLAVSRIGSYSMDVAADSAIVSGAWSDGNGEGTVRAVVNKEGFLDRFTYEGDFE